MYAFGSALARILQSAENFIFAFPHIHAEVTQYKVRFIRRYEMRLNYHNIRYICNVRVQQSVF